jgi:multidrug transporter EmrE-like cation transporter
LAKKSAFIRKYYVYYALGAGLMYGSYSFLFSILAAPPKSSGEDDTIARMFPVFLGQYLFAVFFHCKKSVNTKGTDGVFWSQDQSIYWKKQEIQDPESYHTSRRYSFNWFTLVGILARGIVGAISSMTFYLLVYTSKQAAVNFGVMMCIFSFTPFVTSFGFYLFFKEKLHWIHATGMAFLTACIIILSLS